MDENKFYIDENGLIKLIQGISNSIIEHTSGKINFAEQLNPNTGESEKVLDKPNNFPTVKAVIDYLKDRSNLKVVYDTNSPIVMQDYETTEHQKNYNGEEEIQIDMKLITSKDIKNLFK